LKKGTEESFRVDFEDDPRNKKLAGKNVDFKVEVQDMKAMELPDLDDEFAKGLGEKIETLEEMRNEIRKELTKREERRIDQDLKTRLLQKICDTVEFELPESLVEEELNRAIEGIQQNLSRSGSGLEQSGLDVVKLRQDLRTPAESRVKRMLVLSEIAQLNQIEVTEDDLSKGFAELAEGIGQEAELVRRYYEANNLVESYKDKLLEEKTLNYLVEGAKIFEVEADKISKENSQ
jgi:trigger factor